MRVFIFILLFGVTAICHAIPDGWTPNPAIVEKLASTPLNSITPSLFEEIDPEERIHYSLILSSLSLARSNDLEKAERFAAIATEEGYAKEPIHQIQLHALEMTLGDYRSDTEKTASHGFKAIELFDKAENIPVDLQKHVLDSLVAACFRLGRYDAVYDVASRAQKIANESNLPEMEAMAFADMAQARYKQGNSKESDASAKKALEIFERIGDNSGIGDSKKVLGNSAWLRDEAEVSLEYYTDAITHYEAAGNSHGIANCCYNSALVFMQLKKHQEARVLLEKASKHFINSGSLGGVGMVKMYLAISYWELDEIELAEATFNEARNYLVEAGSFGRLAELEEHVGDMLVSIGRRKEAKEAYLKSMEIFEKTGDDRANGLKGKIDQLDSKV
ncbi:MAG: hypothetical protein KDN19_17390 [Verrucomicrobiae bacterium]|nr:hypothetical protein [Verrucomicrobiae bacterium]